MQIATFKVKTETQTDRYAKFIFEPLPAGFGHTLGNALRRILLSNLKGAAITKVKVEGVKHKFSSLEGMSEDMIDVLLNLKQVKVAYDQDEPTTAHLEVKGPKEVKAKDIQFPPTVRLVNGDQVIAHLNKGATLTMDLTIESGYGYSPATERKAELIGEIPLEALFSPVERVAYDVEQTRVGRRTDFDKLVLEIYTDGSQDPKDVLQEAAKIAVAYFEQIYQPREDLESLKEINSSSNQTQVNEEYQLTIEELGIPTRIANALEKAGYVTVNDLAKASLDDLKSVKNLGNKSIQTIQSILTEKGIQLSEA